MAELIIEKPRVIVNIIKVHDMHSTQVMHMPYLSMLFVVKRENDFDRDHASAHLLFTRSFQHFSDRVSGLISSLTISVHLQKNVSLSLFYISLPYLSQIRQLLFMY